MKKRPDGSLFFCLFLNVKPTETYTLTEAKNKMERYCAYQERCHWEVSRKLREMRMIPAAADEIITHLIRENYLNEERFAKAYARGKFRVKHWGKIRITRELKQRQISAYCINSALKEIDENEYLESFHELAQKKADSLTSGSKQQRQKKFVDYLLYRGWESHLIFEKAKMLFQ